MELRISVLYAPTSRTIHNLRTLLSIRGTHTKDFGDVQPVSCPNLNAISLDRPVGDRTKYNIQRVLFSLTCERF